MINKANIIGLRLGQEDMAAFVAEHGASQFEGTPGFVSKDYVAIPSVMLSNVASLRKWFRLSHANAITLKPKKTSR